MNKEVKFPSYVMNQFSPVLDAKEKFAVQVYAPERIELSKGIVFPLYGSFVLPEENEKEFRFHIIQSIVIAIRGPTPCTRQVGEDDLLFESDIVRKDGSIYGYFNLDLFKHFNLIEHPNRYWISASLFEKVSNIITVEVVN